MKGPRAAPTLGAQVTVLVDAGRAVAGSHVLDQYLFGGAMRDPSIELAKIHLQPHMKQSCPLTAELRWELGRLRAEHPRWWGYEAMTMLKHQLQQDYRGSDYIYYYIYIYKLLYIML